MSFAAHIINELVEQNLVLKDKKFVKADGNKVFYIKVCNPYDSTRQFIIEYYRPNGYISVTVRQILGVVNGKEVYSEPVLYSCHDSCWRSDGTERILYDIKALSLLDSIDKPFGTKTVSSEEYMGFRNDENYRYNKCKEKIIKNDVEGDVRLILKSLYHNHNLSSNIINELVQQSIPNPDKGVVYFIKIDRHIIEFYRYDENCMAILLREVSYIDYDKEKYKKTEVYLHDDSSWKLEETKNILEKIEASLFPLCKETMGIKAVDPKKYKRYISKKLKEKALVPKVNDELITI